MKIEKSITINSYPYTDAKTNKIVNPPPIELKELNVSFQDNPQNKTLFARIEGLPVSILLFGPRTYEALGDNWSKKDLENRLLQVLGDDPQTYLQSLIPKTLEMHPNGPGSILSGMLSSLGIKSAPTCSCKRRALEMNDKGPDWCENNLDQIVGWLEEEAKKRKLPFVKTVAKLMVQRAISKSRRLLAKQANA